MPSTGNDFHDLCTAFGLMTLSWAWAENILASTIGVINRSAGPIKGFPEAPQSLKNKVSCLKIALRDLPALQFVQNDGRVLAERFIELSLRRNKLVMVRRGSFMKADSSLLHSPSIVGITRPKIIASM